MSRFQGYLNLTPPESPHQLKLSRRSNTLERIKASFKAKKEKKPLEKAKNSPFAAAWDASPSWLTSSAAGPSGAEGDDGNEEAADGRIAPSRRVY